MKIFFKKLFAKRAQIIHYNKVIIVICPYCETEQSEFRFFTFKEDKSFYHHCHFCKCYMKVNVEI